jgi:hypothetical protein
MSSGGGTFTNMIRADYISDRVRRREGHDIGGNLRTFGGTFTNMIRGEKGAKDSKDGPEELRTSGGDTALAGNGMRDESKSGRVIAEYSHWQLESNRACDVLACLGGKNPREFILSHEVADCTHARAICQLSRCKCQARHRSRARRHLLPLCGH